MALSDKIVARLLAILTSSCIPVPSCAFFNSRRCLPTLRAPFDCIIGNHAILVNGAQLAGHVHVEDYSTIGSFCRVNQSCRVGSHSYITGDSVITEDVLPFSLVVAPRETRCYGINKVGLEKCGFSPERIQSIEQAYRFLLRFKLNTTQAVEKMLGTLSHSDDVLAIIRFIESAAKRGLSK